jgi:transposase-like protein
MTAPHIVDPARVLSQALSDASPDLMRHLLSTMINALCSAEADAVCGAEYGTVSQDRVNQRNGYRHCRHDRCRDPEAPPGQLLPRLAARAP